MSTRAALPPLTVSRTCALEPAQLYRHGGYHRVHPGEVYNGEYEALQQLGWGRSSTVWLVKELTSGETAAMKVLVGDLAPNKAGGWDEGYPFICHLMDDFVQHGPNGDHVCLLLQPMGVSALDIYDGFERQMPMPITERIAKHVLLALSYVHECGIVHTDIKGDNVLLTGSPLGINGGTVQLSLEEDLLGGTFKLTDFGAANLMSNRFAKLIQPEKLRAPEVLTGAQWNTKADIWNLGCLIYEFVRGAALFDPYWNNATSGMDPKQTHIAQIVGLRGNFPRTLLDQGTLSAQYFDDRGQPLKGAGLYSAALIDLLQRAHWHAPEDIPVVADFLSHALAIDPEERWSAAQLLQHPWLRHVE